MIIVGFLCVPNRTWVQRYGNTERLSDTERNCGLQRLFALVSMPPCIGKSCREVGKYEQILVVWYRNILHVLQSCSKGHLLPDQYEENLCCNIWTAKMGLFERGRNIGCSPLGEQPCPAHLTCFKGSLPDKLPFFLRSLRIKTIIHYQRCQCNCLYIYIPTFLYMHRDVCKYKYI